MLHKPRIATHDQRAMIQSITQLRITGDLLQRHVQFFIGDGRTIPESRNRVVEAIAARYPQEAAAWTLWLDSDIRIPPNSASVIATAIGWAEFHQVCVVANYRMVTGQNVFARLGQLKTCAIIPMPNWRGCLDPILVSN